MAIAGAALAQAWGARHQPEDLLPRFGGDKPRTISGDALAAYLGNLPGARVEHGRQ